MKKGLFMAISKIPIVGPIFKIVTDGEPLLSNSLIREASYKGEDEGWLNYIREYFRNHPDEHPTKKRISDLTDKWNRR